jgi:double-strand break repair protein MRE11
MAPRGNNGEEDDPDPENVFKILIATDNHLGYGEKSPERRNDSYTTFNEILQIARDQDVDFVLLGGDLFHDNRPTRNTEHQCMKILKKHVFGDRPVAMELVSDPKVNFAHCDEEHRDVNYLDPNLNIALPIFSIHGNHDDPSGLGGFCSLDNLHTAGLINYFGRHDNLKEIEVSPLLFKKGEAKLALYGLSSVKDERMHRLFRENCVKMHKPEEDTENWFNIMILHQNRNKHSAMATNYIPEHFIDGMFDLVRSF